ncbi:MAG: hypothetical protein M3Y49_11505 [Actinomycetota bacterium]|nr:hypothetical protein [Actinomycetota bacterium]
MFERFTEGGRRVVVYAQEECRLRNDPHIGTEHLLLGLAQGLDVTSQALVDAGFDTESARQQLEAVTPVRQWATSGHIPFTPRAKRVLEESLRVSNRLAQEHIAPPHLLRGLLGVPDSGGVRLLLALRVDVASLAARAEELAQASAPDAGHHAGRDGITTSTERGRTLSVRRVRQQRDRLRAALVRYGRHEEGCDQVSGCTCGLAQVLSEDVNDQGA